MANKISGDVILKAQSYTRRRSRGNLQAIHDQSQKDKQIIALEIFHIPHDPLAESGDRRGRLKVGRLQEEQPRPHVLSLLVEPLFRVRDLSRDLEKTERDSVI
jgi:hypothetical protein